MKFVILYPLVSRPSVHTIKQVGHAPSWAAVAALTLAYAGGIWIGAALFSHVEARSFLRLHHCEQTCLRPSEFVGLLASIGIQNVGPELPFIAAETDKSIAFLHPLPEGEFHFVIVPKRDIQNIGTLTPDEESYLVDAYAVIQELIRTQHLSKYRVITNGPGYQKVAYLHFHLIGEQ